MEISKKLPFYWLLLGFTGFYGMLLTVNWVSLGFTGFYWVLWDAIRSLLGFTGFRCSNLFFFGLHWVWFGFHRFLSRFTELNRI